LQLEVKMKIGIVGAGMIARAVAAVAIKHGHEVMVSNTRSRDTMFSLVGTLGCEAGTPEEAAAFGEVVLIAIPLKNYKTVPVAPLEGKIVLDANNYYPERDGHIDELDSNETTTSELLGRHLPKSRIVKAFNAIQASQIERDGRPKGSSDRRALPIAGDEPAAKRSWRIFLINSGSTSWTLVRLPEGGGSRRTHLPIACRLIPPS
jgi:8-hydroxy-5-deazaflavin:NADPH oxidoreductase